MKSTKNIQQDPIKYTMFEYNTRTTDVDLDYVHVFPYNHRYSHNSAVRR